MSARWRKLIGGIALLVFVAVYAVTAAKLFDHLPNWLWLRLAYMAVVGIGWGVPIIPLISWMNRGR